MRPKLVTNASAMQYDFDLPVWLKSDKEQDNTINLGNIISEDCLTMNIIRPSGYDGVQLPVAVWIHG
jgi:carboxylesterase type B